MAFFLFGGLALGCRSDSTELADIRAEAALYPLDEQSAVVVSPVPYRSLFHTLFGITASDEEGEVAAAEVRWKRSALKLDYFGEWRDLKPPFVEMGGLLAAITTDDNGHLLELFDARTGHTRASAQLPELVKDHAEVGEEWGIRIAAFGELLVVAYPARVVDGLVMRVIGFKADPKTPYTPVLLNPTFDFDVPLQREALRTLVVTECQIILISGSGNRGRTTAWPRPDRDCEAQHPSLQGALRSETYFHVIVLAQTAEHAVLEYNYWNSTPHQASHKELWIFDPRHSTMLSRWPRKGMRPLHENDSALYRPLDPGIPTSGHVALKGVWVDRWSIVPPGPIAPGIVPEVLQGDWYDVRTIVRYSLSGRPPSGQSVLPLTTEDSTYARELAVAFGVGDHLITIDHMGGLRFRFHKDLGWPATAIFDPIIEPFMDEFRVGPQTSGEPRLLAAARARRFFRVGDSPKQTSELQPPERFRAALAQGAHMGAFPGRDSFWVLGPDGVIRWKVPALRNANNP